MKRKLIIFIIMTLIILIFKNYQLVLSSTIDGVNIWFYKVFPYLFIMIIIQDLLINLDFADVKAVMEKRGNALIGIGIGVGENRATEAALQAVSSPLLETSIDGATDAIINVTGGSNLTLFEVEEAAETIRKSANTDINTIFGAVINENLNDEIIVTVIATGFEDEEEEPSYQSYDKRNETRTESRVSVDDDDDETNIPSFLRKRGF